MAGDVTQGPVDTSGDNKGPATLETEAGFSNSAPVKGARQDEQPDVAEPHQPDPGFSNTAPAKASVKVVDEKATEDKTVSKPTAERK